MFERPPSQPEWASWLIVGLWSGVIFATVPLARALQRAVNERWGEEAFLYVVALALALAFAWTLRHLRSLGRLSAGRWAWLSGVALVYAGYTYSLRGNPVEAIHFIEYGALGVLAFRALSHRMRDPLIYPAAALVGVIVGLLDEAIQWATPDRVWDLRDVWFNFVGAGLVQLGIAAGIRPALVSARITAAGVQTLCRVALVALLLLGASLLNTPARIGWYATRVPGLGFLLKSSDVMLEYGHLYDVAGVGRFRSRFSAEELERIDALRGAEVGALLADASDDDYKSFLAEYTPITDPFVHEVRVHLFRRDRYLLTAEWHLDDVDWYRRDITVGHRENRILELLYPNTLRHSGRAFSPERLAYLEEMQFPEREYESRVSKGLVTRIGERHVVVGGALLLALLAVTQRAAARRAERGATR